MAGLVVARAMDFQSGSPLGVVPVSAVRPEGFEGLLSSLPGTGRIRSELVLVSVSCKQMDLDE